MTNCPFTAATIAAARKTIAEHHWNEDDQGMVKVADAPTYLGDYDCWIIQVRTETASTGKEGFADWVLTRSGKPMLEV